MMLYQLQEKLRALIRQFNQVQQNETLLKKKVSSLEDTIQLQEEKIQQLEEELMIKRLGENDDQQALKTYIDNIINEIDNTIKNL
ncbi:hypothetical protein DBR32_04900 [Taibaiella sp. KBW10]|uniref:hypothetical protein n=1 Tax=Taibaiella sp. KBW10 TaxID=2153357 RepID=UPI000F59190A|nr:hypothetical protein [Taibaiella sp. KBW10]RQO31304.1 hypothetical protein DBR32_04900 [Taibaiella sp. KBW10]